MTGEDESTDPGMAAAEREIIKFLSRDANEATFDYDGARENRGKPAINQSMEHAAPAIPVKQKKTAEELAAMIHHDLSQIEGCAKRGVKVTVYGLNPWNSLLTFGVDAGPVPNKSDLLAFCDVITERLKRLYVIEV
jgi:hypothetical protein